MMKWFHKLSWKIFLLIFFLSMLSSLFTIACISFFVPTQFLDYTYSFENSVSDLQDQLSKTESTAEQEIIIHQFSADSGYSYSYRVQDESDTAESDSMIAREEEWTLEEPDPDSITFVIDQKDTAMEVTVFKNTALLDQIFSTFWRSLVPIVLWVFLLSLILSALYSRYISGPIIKLDQISLQMMDMKYKPQKETFSKDEIGELSHNIHLLYKRLSSSIESLEEKNAQQQAFFQAASHDLKTPLTIMEGSIELLHEQSAKGSLDPAYLENSLQACKRMEKIVESILSLTRLEGEVKLSLQKIRVDELVRREIIELLPFLEKKEQVLQLNLEKMESMLDPSLFSLAIRNLLMNAIAYSPVHETVRIRNQEDSLIIENTGVSLEEKDLEHLFEPFYRAEASRNSQSGGNGLGLSISQKILEAHGFFLRVENSSEGVLAVINFTKTS